METQNQLLKKLFKNKTPSARVLLSWACTAALTGLLVVRHELSVAETPNNLSVTADTLVVLDEMQISSSEAQTHVRSQVLADFDNRISDQFDIPQNMQDRVGFWFDIYTKYNSHKRVIHHSRYPWIIFDVIDVTPIIEAETPKFRWMRNQKADKVVEQELKQFKKSLSKIVKTGTIDAKNNYEVAIGKALTQLKGGLSKKARLALESIRVQTGQQNFFAAGLEISPIYLSGMEEIFAEHKLPTELTRLPFVESSFNHKAVSKVGASGIWQFMSYTAKNFLTVNDFIDERNSPIKASVAAAKLLKENHMILHRSWPLALSAWNHGPNGIRKAMKATGTRDLGKIVDSYNSKTFDFASSNFYAGFLAALYAEKYNELMFTDLKHQTPFDLHLAQLSRQIKTRDVLKLSGLTEESFLFYNPDLSKALKSNIQLPKGFRLIVDNPSRDALADYLSKTTLLVTEAKVAPQDIAL